MDNNIYKEALNTIVGGLGSIVEPSARMAIESYYMNPVLHPISKYGMQQTEDKFRDAAASLNLFDDFLKKGGVVFSDGLKRIENPTFEDTFKAAQRLKKTLAEEKYPSSAYEYGGKNLALEAEKRKVRYVRPKYY